MALDNLDDQGMPSVVGDSEMSELTVSGNALDCSAIRVGPHAVERTSEQSVTMPHITWLQGYFLAVARYSKQSVIELSAATP